MKTKRKILALVMSVAMVLTMLPAMVYADGESQPDASAGFKANEPVSVTSNIDLEGIVGTDELSEGNDIYTNGNGFEVTYADGTEIKFYYEKHEVKDESGNVEEFDAFFPQYYDEQGSADPAIYDNDEFYALAYIDIPEGTEFKRGENYFDMYAYIPYFVDEEGNVGVKEFDMQQNVWCNYFEPVAVRFEPADGFVPTGCIGKNYIFEYMFYGKGNKFIVTYEFLGWSEETQDYTEKIRFDEEYAYFPADESKQLDEGFYNYHEEGGALIPFESERFELGWNNEGFLEKGLNEVPLVYITDSYGTTETFEVPFTVQMNAEKYEVYSNYPSFEYTGKAVTAKQLAKKFKLYSSDDKLIPASDYTYEFKSGKALGWYEISVRFNDTEKYPEEGYMTFYSITPKTPVIKSVKGGKKQLTVNWKKFTAAQLKSIDAMYIEIANDKDFISGYKVVDLKKSAIKKGSKTIKKLKANKKYYVRLCTYKKVKDGDGHSYIFSPDSKKKSARTKK